MFDQNLLITDGVHKDGNEGARAHARILITYGESAPVLVGCGSVESDATTGAAASLFVTLTSH